MSGGREREQPTPAAETVQEWAERVLRERGPIPEAALARLRRAVPEELERAVVEGEESTPS